MILADKIIRLRKKNGWSQEELAAKMNVSRQAVSKWEGAQTIPDLEKILQLSDLFGVTTDYLLKDEIENEEFTDSPSDSIIRKITISEANTFLEQRKSASRKIALATFLCIMSPVTLILLGSMSEYPQFGISETFAGVVGLVTLFALVLCAVPIYIYCGFKNESFAFLDESIPFELEYGIKGMVTERQKNFKSTYVVGNIIATCLCIFSPIPLIVSAFIQNDLLSTVMLTVMFFIAGIATSIFIVVGVQNESMNKLLMNGEYSAANKRKSNKSLKELVESAFWGILVAVYLLWSFTMNSWHISWILFVMGGALSPLVSYICDRVSGNKHNND